LLIFCPESNCVPEKDIYSASGITNVNYILKYSDHARYREGPSSAERRGESLATDPNVGGNIK
jgi:hypothetical protein